MDSLAVRAFRYLGRTGGRISGLSLRRKERRSDQQARIRAPQAAGFLGAGVPPCRASVGVTAAGRRPENGEGAAPGDRPPGLSAGSTMLLRETSLMPHIPGLPALLSMLFAPVMELR